MTAQKHSKTRKPSDKDLKENPGIGQSPGLGSAEDADLLKGNSTFEGDTENNATRSGGVNPRDRPRGNRPRGNR
ncbi:hypothetical protein ACUSIJ_10910 [Pseudochelatococcus sp. B33]